MQHPLRIQSSIFVLMALAALSAPAMAGPPPRPVPQVRVVYVTNSLCGLEALGKANPHVETLACMAQGARLQLYDLERDILYEIQFLSEELRIELQNDYSGLQVGAQGLWDDRQGRVKLQRISPFQSPASREVAEVE